MSAPQRFFNIKTFTHNAVVYTGVKMVSVEQTHKEIEDGGDNDAFSSFYARGPGKTKISVDIADPVQGLALAAAGKGSTSFIGVPESSATTGLATVTATNAEYMNVSVGAKYGEVWAQKVSGGAANSDGTNPLSIAVA